MHKQIYISLPVKDLEASKTFYLALGFGLNPQFTGEDAVGIVISDNIYLMLSTEAVFQTLTTKTIVDSRTHVEWSRTLSCESKEELIALVDKAKAAGGKVDAYDDYGFMYQGWFEDPDGHHRGVMWLDANQMPQ